MINKTLRRTAAATWACLLAATVSAQQPAPPATDAPTSSAATAAGRADFARPVDVAQLEAARGGSQAVYNDMNVNGNTTGNTADHVVTGTNSIGSGAFANMSGLPVVIQNSGANVLIQNSMIVHLQMN